MRKTTESLKRAQAAHVLECRCRGFPRDIVAVTLCDIDLVCYKCLLSERGGKRSVAEISEFKIYGNKIGKAEPNSIKKIWLIGDQQRNTSLRHDGIVNDRKLPEPRKLQRRGGHGMDQPACTPIRWHAGARSGWDERAGKACGEGDFLACATSRVRRDLI